MILAASRSSTPEKVLLTLPASIRKNVGRTLGFLLYGFYVLLKIKEFLNLGAEGGIR